MDVRGNQLVLPSLEPYTFMLSRSSDEQYYLYLGTGML